MICVFVKSRVFFKVKFFDLILGDICNFMIEILCNILSLSLEIVNEKVKFIICFIVMFLMFFGFFWYLMVNES